MDTNAPKIWRINVNNQALSVEEPPEAWINLGGRGLTAQILLDEVEPTCYPLGPHNKLIFAPGLLTGHMLSSCDRVSVGGKSPLTGGIKESNAGGTTGLQMASLGIKALIIEGLPEDSGWWVLHLRIQGARFDPASDLAGLGVYESASRLLDRYGGKVALSLIGPAGEMKLAAAGIQNLDKDRTASRIAARGGLGALMGSKGLKAIVFDATGSQKPAIADPAAYKDAQRDYNRALMDHPQTQVYRDYGTAAMAQMSNGFGGIPTRNYSRGQFESVEEIGGEHLRELLLERGGVSSPTHACMPGCTIRCSNIYGDQQDQVIVAPLEYETIGLMGSNLEISDLDAIASLSWQANDLGLDSIDTGAALGVAAEAGLMEFGDVKRAHELLDEIRRGTPLGRVLGNGAAHTGKTFGVEHVPVVKGQAMAAYDPRAIKGTGVTYATSPMGADHTAGLTIRAKINHLEADIQVEASRAAQINVAGYDSLGACSFSGFGFAAAPPGTLARLLQARYGCDFPDDILQVLGKQTLKVEREFNRRAGFTSADDRIPEWMTREALPPNQSVFDVKESDLDSIFNF